MSDWNDELILGKLDSILKELYQITRLLEKIADLKKE